MKSTIRNALEALLNRLEKVAQEHEELTDTDVRETLHRTLSHYFVWGNEPAQLPLRYGMFSQVGDQHVGGAVREFLEKVRCAEDLSSLRIGADRLHALQDRTVRTEGGMSYDDFIGHLDSPLPPERLPTAWFQPASDEADIDA